MIITQWEFNPSLYNIILYINHCCIYKYNKIDYISDMGTTILNFNIKVSCKRRVKFEITISEVERN